MARVRHAVGKVVNRFMTPRQRALQGIYQELAGIKGSLAILESQTTSKGSEKDTGRGVAKPVAEPTPQTSWNSLIFAAQFRGSVTQIKENQCDYLEYFRGTGLTLDIGCGRGEFLELLREHSISGVGVELDSIHLKPSRFDPGYIQKIIDEPA